MTIGPSSSIEMNDVPLLISVTKSESESVSWSPSVAVVSSSSAERASADHPHLDVLVEHRRIFRLGGARRARRRCDRSARNCSTLIWALAGSSGLTKRDAERDKIVVAGAEHAVVTRESGLRSWASTRPG